MQKWIQRILFILQILGFEKKETHGENKDEGIDGRTEEQFLQKGADFSAGGASDAFGCFPCAEEIVEEEAGSDNQKNPGGNALRQILGREDDDSP